MDEDENALPVYAEALSDLTATSVPVGKASSKGDAARLIRKAIEERDGDADSGITAGDVAYSRSRQCYAIDERKGARMADVFLVLVDHECTPYMGRTTKGSTTHLVSAKTADEACEKAREHYERMSQPYGASWHATACTVPDRIGFDEQEV